jgi:hypothetical protein
MGTIDIVLVVAAVVLIGAGLVMGVRRRLSWLAAGTQILAMLVLIVAIVQRAL